MVLSGVEFSCYMHDTRSLSTLYLVCTQVRFKPPALPTYEPDSVQPIFGVRDVTLEKKQEQRWRAKQVFQDQLDMVKQKQQLSSLKAQKNQTEEADMLKRAKEE